jgi:bifunctional non-homologous end joining protein LigD
MTRFPAPMLASAAGELPDLKGWALEPKWDGFRVIAEVSTRRVHLWSRNGIDKSTQFPEVSAALQEFAREQGALTLDGELVAIDKAGRPQRFQALQARANNELRTAFVVFDVLDVGKKDVRRLPWHARRELLETLVPKSSRALIRRGESVRCGSAGARRIVKAARAEGWEGIILKQVDSTYTPGKRSDLWRKVKLEKEQEFVIGGYTLPNEGADRDYFGALLVGYHDDDGRLVYAGKVGTGYTQKTIETLGKKLVSLRRVKSPFVAVPRAREKSVWIKPELVAQIRYNEMTEGGILRQPVFLGLRDDKAAKDVKLESATSSGAILHTLSCAT